MSNISQFDVATAALEHLQLLNLSNQNPLEIAAQFRTLLRSKKPNKNVHISNIDYITTSATIRRRRRSRSLADHRLKSLDKIQYHLFEEESNSKYLNPDNLIEDINLNSSISSSHSINKTNQISKEFQYPIINWKQLREKQYENKLNKVKQFISTKFKTTHLSRIETIDLTISKSSSSRSSSYTIRTPSISPINSPQPTYTISRLNSTLINHNNDDIFFPIADCNLIIKHKSISKHIPCCIAK